MEATFETAVMQFVKGDYPTAIAQLQSVQVCYVFYVSAALPSKTMLKLLFLSLLFVQLYFLYPFRFVPVLYFELKHLPRAVLITLFTTSVL